MIFLLLPAMIIAFETKNEILEYLVTKSKITVTRFSEPMVIFNEEKSTIDDFMKMLTNLDIIIPKTTWKKEFDFETKEFIEITGKLTYEFHQRNFDLLYSNELFQNNIHQFRLLTVNETASILGVTRQTVYAILKDKKLSSYQILSQQKVKYSELMKYIEEKKNH